MCSHSSAVGPFHPGEHISINTTIRDVGPGPSAGHLASTSPAQAPKAEFWHPSHAFWSPFGPRGAANAPRSEPVPLPFSQKDIKLARFPAAGGRLAPSGDPPGPGAGRLNGGIRVHDITAYGIMDFTYTLYCR